MESDRFYRRMLKIAKDPRQGDEKLEQINEAFRGSLPDDLPDDMIQDLFWGCADALELSAISDRDQLHNASTALTMVVELFWEEFGSTEGELPGAIWETIRDCVNDFALDLDESLLNYVMKEVVDQGKI